MEPSDPVPGVAGESAAEVDDVEAEEQGDRKQQHRLDDPIVRHAPPLEVHERSRSQRREGEQILRGAEERRHEHLQGRKHGEIDDRERHERMRTAHEAADRSRERSESEHDDEGALGPLVLDAGDEDGGQEEPRGRSDEVATAERDPVEQRHSP